MMARFPEYDLHPLAELFPLMNDHDAGELARSIRAVGLQKPIVLYQGKILDGRNRYTVCANLKITPTFTTYEGDDPLGYVIAANLARRHLTESQRAAVAAKIANMRQGRPEGNPANLPLSVPQQQAAAMLNVSERSVRSARAVIDKGAPELVAMVERGEVAVSAASEVARLPAARQHKIVEQGAKRVREAAREQRGIRPTARTKTDDPIPHRVKSMLRLWKQHIAEAWAEMDADERRIFLREIKRNDRLFTPEQEQWLPKVLAMWEEGTEADRRKFMAAIMEYA